MSQETIARRYAAALADVTTKSSDMSEAHEVQKELIAWTDMFRDSPALLEVFRNPTINYERKRNVLNALIERTRPRAKVANFLQVLLQNGRLADLFHISERYAQVLDERAGILSAQITTARPVDQAQRELLRTQLEKLNGREMRLEFGVDESLIGGIVTRIGSTVYDGSVRTQLDEMRQQLAGNIR